MFMNKFAFVVAYTDNYIKGVTAFKNSAKIHCPDVDIIELRGDSVEGTAIERFNVACQVGEQYEAICLVDADMFLTNDVRLFFEVASKGFIITGSNGMVINFNQDYQNRYGIDLGGADYIYPKVHTTVPIFINKDNLDWFRRLYNSKRIDSWDDFLYLNILGIKLGKDKKMIVLPPYVFTGIHHWQLKPETAVFKGATMLLSGTEEIVYMVHGKWWDEGWLQDLMPTMTKYLQDENMGEKCEWRVKQAMVELKNQFEYYLNYV
jgi:hypothetical protein